MTPHRIAIIIPCYNVEQTILSVLSSFDSVTLGQINEIIVIDNNSSDHTFELLKKVSLSDAPISHSLTIIRNQKNYGYGGSQKIAYKYLLSSENTHFMIIHGDNQGNSDMIAQNFLNELKKNSNTDVILASRFTSNSNISEYSWIRTRGNQFFNFLTYLLTGLNMSDAGSAIICLKTNVLKEIPFTHLDSAFHFHPQLNILLYSNHRITIKEIPLSWKDSPVGSNVNIIKYGIKMLNILTRYWINRTIFRKSPYDHFVTKSDSFSPTFTIFKKPNELN